MKLRAREKRRIERIRAELRAKEDGLVCITMGWHGNILMPPQEVHRVFANKVNNWFAPAFGPEWRDDPSYNWRRKKNALR